MKKKFKETRKFLLLRKNFSHEDFQKYFKQNL